MTLVPFSSLRGGPSGRVSAGGSSEHHRGGHGADAHGLGHGEMFGARKRDGGAGGGIGPLSHGLKFPGR